MCQQVVDAGGDYLFIVKGNRQALDNDIALIFAKPPVGAHFDSTRRVEKQKGRIEKRELTATDALNGYIDWPGVAKVCQIRRVTESKGRRVEEVRYAITSLSGNAEELLALVRGHWAIENRLHRVRDVTLGEDACQVRKGAAPQVLAGFRNAVIGALRLLGYENIAAAMRSIAWRQEAVRLVCGFDP